jgi:putative transposase
MNDFTTEILKTLANKGDLNELFRVHLEKAVNTLLKTVNGFPRLRKVRSHWF